MRKETDLSTLLENSSYYELVLEILSYLPPEHLANTKLVSRIFRFLSDKIIWEKLAQQAHKKLPESLKSQFSIPNPKETVAQTYKELFQTMNATYYFNQIPEAALLEILSYLKGYTLSNVSMVSQKFKQLADNPALWKRLIEEFQTKKIEKTSTPLETANKGVYFSQLREKIQELQIDFLNKYPNIIMDSPKGKHALTDKVMLSFSTDETSKILLALTNCCNNKNHQELQKFLKQNSQEIIASLKMSSDFRSNLWLSLHWALANEDPKVFTTLIAYLNEQKWLSFVIPSLCNSEHAYLLYKLAITLRETQLLDPNGKNQPLIHYVIDSGFVALVELIVAYDPYCITYQNSTRENAFFYALKNGVVSTTTDYALLPAATTRTAKVFYASSPVIYSPFLPILKFCPEILNMPNQNNETVLNFIYKFSSKDLIEILNHLSSDFIKNYRFNDGLTFLHLATQRKSIDLIKYLSEKHSWLIDVVDSQGETSLMYAIRSDNQDTFKLLLDAGADVNIKNCKGDSALELAIMSLDRVNNFGSPSFIRMLLAKNSYVDLNKINLIFRNKWLISHKRIDFFEEIKKVAEQQGWRSPNKLLKENNQLKQVNSELKDKVESLGAQLAAFKAELRTLKELGNNKVVGETSEKESESSTSEFAPK